MRRPIIATFLAFTLVAAACTDDGTTTPGTEPTTTLIAPDLEMVAGQPIPEARCQANRDAGTIVYLSSFDFAATASIVDVLVAKSKGYYDALCLDVDVKPSFSVDNYPQIAANDAQFSSGGSFSEMVDFAGANDAGFVALAVEGRTGIDALITKDGEVPTLADIKGTKIGVKGAITPSVKAMLAQQGLIEGEDYETVLLDGFDPLVHIEVPDIVGFPGYKSNEPLQLEAAGVPFTLYDPTDYDIPGSFGVVYTNDTFLTEHPTAAQDFMRATMRGLADAVADPAAASDIAIGFIDAGDNIMFLSAESETARWGVESTLVGDGVAPGAPLGLPLMDQLTAEVTTYASIGLFDGVAPDITTMVDPAVLAGIYAADGTIIWPAEG
ncbi:MAG: ABC transporter substrate-binding protein [Ilumatobacteraceae bacterium]|nr:ABC transporter substrate-binding protein [Ilumatobacteraceae bacterium]